MKKNAKTELALSEEQLQDITGGCAQCVADIKQATHHLAMTKTYLKLAETAIARNKDSTLYRALSNGHINAAETLTYGVVTRSHHV